jgi:hypothetical protein
MASTFDASAQLLKVDDLIKVTIKRRILLNIGHDRVYGKMKKIEVGLGCEGLVA